MRVGNGAWDQHQNDVWGMILDAVDIYLRQGAPHMDMDIDGGRRIKDLCSRSHGLLLSRHRYEPRGHPVP